MNYTEYTCPKLSERYFKGVHSSGLEIIVIPKKQRTLYALLSTRYGSINNRFKLSGEKDFHDVPEGVAHFLEHKLFENSNGEDTFLRFSKLGASCNAFTSNDVTSYLFTSTENYHESIKELISFVFDPFFTPETVQKEMGIIEQELRMYEDNPNRALYENMLTCLYKNHPARISVGGTVDSIKKITSDTLYFCYNTFYNPYNMFLIVCGDITPEEVSDIVDRTIPKKEKVLVDKADFFEDEGVACEFHTAHFPVSLPLFRIGVKDPDLDKSLNAPLRRELEHNILLELLFGHSSALFEELYEAGLINHKFDASYQVSLTFSHSVMSGESRDVRRVYQRVKKEVEAYRCGEKTFSQKDFDRVVKMTYGMCAQVWNSTTDIADAVLDYELTNSRLCDLPDILASITLDDIKKRLDRSYKSEYFVLSEVLPNE